MALAVVGGVKRNRLLQYFDKNLHWEYAAAYGSKKQHEQDFNSERKLSTQRIKMNYMVTCQEVKCG